MAGERDLAVILATLDPTLYPDRYSFSTTERPVLQDGDFAIVREEEGLTLIRLDPAGEWARISLGVHSSLDAVGLTAILSARLSDAGISANIISAYYHDHLFVQWERRDEALACIRSI